MTQMHPILAAHIAAGLPPLTEAQEAALDDLIIGLESIHCTPTAHEVADTLRRVGAAPTSPPPPPPSRPRIIGRRFSSDFAEPQSFTIWDQL